MPTSLCVVSSEHSQLNNIHWSCASAILHACCNYTGQATEQRSCGCYVCVNFSDVVCGAGSGSAAQSCMAWGKQKGMGWPTSLSRASSPTPSLNTTIVVAITIIGSSSHTIMVKIFIITQIKISILSKIVQRSHRPPAKRSEPNHGATSVRKANQL